MTEPAVQRRRSPQEIGIMALVFSFLLVLIYSVLPEAEDDIETHFCPEPQALTPSGAFRNSSYFYSDEYSNFSLNALQGAIRVPSMSFDDMDLDPVKEPRFEVFKQLHQHLFTTFPLSAKSVEVVNTYGLLYTFEGSQPELKPLVLMSHQDVVPVPKETWDQWDYEPFSGEFDGEWLHGRGTSDTKDTLVGILEATEALLQQGWQPRRTVLLAFGFDEEISGYRGAQYLANTIKDRFGSNGVEMVIDEGFGLPEMYGALVAAIAVGEKGYLDLVVTLDTPGGHSSAPPDHTGIGILSKLVKRLEAHPFSPELEEINPTLGLYRCLAENAPNMNKELRRTVLDIDAKHHRSDLIKYISNIPEQKYLVRSSQAVDVISGGVKINALPEQVTLRVNHRISPSSGVAAVIERFEDYVVELASDFGLGVESRGETLLKPTKQGVFNITAPRALEPAPLSPHRGSQWSVISGTTYGVLKTAPFTTKPLVVAPALFPANTDTKHYWDLSRAIYRFKPALGEDVRNYHTVNERLRFRSHLLTVAWYYEFIQNAAE